MRFSKAPITLILLLIFTTANKFNPVAQYATANNKSSDGELLAKIQSILEPLESVIDTSIFLTQLFTPSTIYKFKDLNAALEVVALDGACVCLVYRLMLIVYC